MEIEIIFMDAAAPKKIVCDNVYTKGQMLCVRQGGVYLQVSPYPYLLGVP